jgi:hypothetical protein
LPGSQWQILNSLERDLRESDPELVSSFAALATNPPQFHLIHRRRLPRMLLRLRCALGARRARMATARRQRIPVVMALPVAILALLSTLIFVLPGPSRHTCGTVTAAPVFVRQRVHCAPSSQAGHQPIHPAISRPGGP